ncbi:MAG TPA: phosphatase PAP2 family protein [Mycobacteriales bacterium]|nr:phosphatase PAP2 family protein [Mycobacteriales bacterium]
MTGLPASLARRMEPGARFGLRVTLLAVALSLVGVPFGLLLAQVKSNGPLVRVDTYAANHLHNWVLGHDTLESALRGVSYLGSPPWFYLLIGSAAVYWWLHGGHVRLSAFLVTTGLLGGAVDTVVKVVVDRDRPSLTDPIATAHGQSFPSGHTMLATYGYGALLLAFLPLLPGRLHRPAIGAWLAMVALIAFSRLALGVHYISDVLGGFVLGLAWLVAMTAAFSIWRVERGKPPVHPTEGLEPEVARD